MKVSKITEATAHDLAKKNLEVFVNDVTPTEYITYPEIAAQHLGADEYIEASITEDERQTFSLITYHFINYNESSYPVRYDIKFFPDNNVSSII